jgi:hypothetical protein
MYGLLNQVSNNWLFGPYSYGAGLFFSIRTSYDFNKSVYYKLFEMVMAVEKDFLGAEAELSFAISHLGTGVVVRKDDTTLKKSIAPLLINWDKLKESD